jgi:hypothetical protein
MASTNPSGYVPNVYHPEVMRSILQGMVEIGDVIGTAGPGQTILAVTVDPWWAWSAAFAYSGRPW